MAVQPVPGGALEASAPGGPSSAAVRERIAAARQRQEDRNGTGVWNARVDPLDPRTGCRLGPEEKALLREAHARNGLSARGHVRAIRVARTIADLEGARAIGWSHLAEALRYREVKLGTPEPTKKDDRSGAAVAAPESGIAGERGARTGSP